MQTYIREYLLSSIVCNGITPFLYPFQLVFLLDGQHCIQVRIIPMLVLFATAGWAETAFGTWQVNAARSTLAGDIRPKSLTVRIEPHARARCSHWTGSRQTAGVRVPARFCISNGEPRGVRISHVRESNPRGA